MGDLKHRLVVCQHCGDINLTQDELTGKWSVYCACGFAQRKTRWYGTEREAIKAWDRVCMDWEG